MKPNTVYTDLEIARLREKATNAVAFLEKESYYADDFNSDEVVSIATAITATEMAELQALEWAKGAKAVEIEYRIKQLKQKI